MMTKTTGLWFVGLGTVGAAAAGLSGLLVWRLLTEPFELAMTLAGVLP